MAEEIAFLQKELEGGDKDSQEVTYLFKYLMFAYLYNSLQDSAFYAAHCS